MNMLSSPTMQNIDLQLQRDADTNRAPLRSPELPDDAHILITLVVLIPIIVTVILCLITACIYRYKKKRAPQNMRPNDQHNTAMGRRFNRSQGNPFVIEELPPSYDLISETKKDLSFITETKDAYEQFDLSPIKNEMVMATPPPPYNSDHINSTKPV